MKRDELYERKYSIGKFKIDHEITKEKLENYIKNIEETPLLLRDAVKDLSEEQLNTPYREGGWTVRQLVHHIADSHMNSYIRIKLAVTENEPIIKAYDQDAWAEEIDSFKVPISVSLDILEALHKRWTVYLRSLTKEQLNKNYTHPEVGSLKVDKTIASYAWHGKHHVAQITSLRTRMGF